MSSSGFDIRRAEPLEAGGDDEELEAVLSDARAEANARAGLLPQAWASKRDCLVRAIPGRCARDDDHAAAAVRGLKKRCAIARGGYGAFCCAGLLVLGAKRRSLCERELLLGLVET